jgi:hypothetical protein
MLEVTLTGLTLILVLAPLGCAAWILMLRAMLKALSIQPKWMLKEISVAEAIFFAGYAFSSAYLVAALFSRFV